MTGVGPVEAAVALAVALAELDLQGKRPDLVVSLGSAGSRRLARTEVYQAVSVTYRRFTSKEGPSRLAQGVSLPLSDTQTGDSRFFLMHTNWRPVGTDWIAGNVEVDYQNTCERRMVSFKAAVPEATETVLI